MKEMEALSDHNEISYRSTDLSTPLDTDRVKELFSINGYPRSFKEVHWIYESFDGCSSHAALAESGETVAALYATVPCRFQLNGQTVLAAQSLDTMVDSRFRGAGLFTKLANIVNKNMEDSGVCFVYGFPNGNSYSGFVRKLQWSSLDPVPFLFRPISLRYALDKVGGNLGRFFPFRIPSIGKRGRSEILPTLPAPEAVDKLWESFSSQLNVARVRDHTFLTKRYVNHPRALYKFRGCYEGDQLTGLLIYCIEDKHGGRIGYIMEMICRSGDAGAARSLLVDTLNDMVISKCDGVLAWCFNHSPHFKQYLNQLFFPLPSKIRPIELHFGLRAFTSHDKSSLGDRKSWYLSYSDSDTV